MARSSVGGVWIFFNDPINYFFSAVLQYQEQVRKEKGTGKSRAAPHCRACGHPRKGHKNVKDCPLNM